MKKPLWSGRTHRPRWTAGRSLAATWPAEGLFTRAERDRAVAAAVGPDLRR
ncbi:hypothetical protein AB0E27_28620 [Streptomyces sparsogenes]|uniref:hypothetical protein n=1 Tax=Streptomyces sparsogenes TaxID=67365 RepID=UPI0033DD2CB8